MVWLVSVSLIKSLIFILFSFRSEKRNHSSWKWGKGLLYQCWIKTAFDRHLSLMLHCNIWLYTNFSNSTDWVCSYKNLQNTCYYAHVHRVLSKMCNLWHVGVFFTSNICWTDQVWHNTKIYFPSPRKCIFISYTHMLHKSSLSLKGLYT